MEIAPLKNDHKTNKPPPPPNRPSKQGSLHGSSTLKSYLDANPDIETHRHFHGQTTPWTRADFEK